MSNNLNTLLLRLAGPMQAWGTSSRFQLRRTDPYPSKSGVLGMLLCAMGVSRKDSLQALEPLTPLLMGVRVDRCGILDWDYHTAGAKIGIRQAKGGIKKTATTKEPETLLSRRQYLYDASFLVALQGATDAIKDCGKALDNPAWPLFLGRKCCIPAEPVFVGVESFATLTDALSAIPWQPRIDAIDRDDYRPTRTLDIYMEHPPGPQIPTGARVVYDVPKAFGFYNSYAPRWVAKDQVTVAVGEAIQRLQQGTRRSDPYSKHFKEIARPRRLKLDNDLCVFCKSPAKEVHHVSYQNAGHETDSDLRSLCKICHDACTMLEYSHGMEAHRVDPSDPAQRQAMRHQIKRLLSEGHLGRRRELLKTARTVSKSFYDTAPSATQGKED